MTDHAHDHDAWTHGHVFLGQGHGNAERRTRLAATVTALFMVVEIAAGAAFGSMALLADGVHMATHVGALGLAARTYFLARRHADNTRFTFGSGKFGDLAAFSSAIILGLIAFGVAWESIERLLWPVAVRYSEALPIAAIGLVINIISAAILHEPHEHRNHAHGDHHHDHNLRAAYVHVAADAAPSLLAIGALTAGLFFHTAWLDPLVGVIGAGVIASWSYGLIRDSGMVLLDAEDDPKLAAETRGLIVSLVCPDQNTAVRVRETLRERYADLSHVTVEIAVCADCT